MENIDKKSVLCAYDSYILSEKAKKKMILRSAEEEDLFEILRVLTNAYPIRRGFFVKEISYVGECLFLNRPNWIDVEIILNKAQREGKVVCEEGEWKLAL